MQPSVAWRQEGGSVVSYGTRPTFPNSTRKDPPLPWKALWGFPQILFTERKGRHRVTSLLIAPRAVPLSHREAGLTGGSSVLISKPRSSPITPCAYRPTQTCPNSSPLPLQVGLCFHALLASRKTLKGKFALKI